MVETAPMTPKVLLNWSPRTQKIVFIAVFAMLMIAVASALAKPALDRAAKLDNLAKETATLQQQINERSISPEEANARADALNQQLEELQSSK